jgi:hypothetical protein
MKNASRGTYLSRLCLSSPAKVNYQIGTMDTQLELLVERANRAHIAFLRAELALGFTYAQTAKVEDDFDPEGVKRAKELAENALDTIEHFSDRITDTTIQLELQKGAAKLAQLLGPHPGTQI